MFLLKAALSLQVCLPKHGHQKLWLFPDFLRHADQVFHIEQYCCHRGAETQKVKTFFPVFKYEMDTVSHVMCFYMIDLFLHMSCRNCSSITGKNQTRIVWNVFLLDAVKTADLVTAAY